MHVCSGFPQIAYDEAVMFSLPQPVNSAGEWDTLRAKDILFAEMKSVLFDG